MFTLVECWCCCRYVIYDGVIETIPEISDLLVEFASRPDDTEES